jgi:hypothetical protein
MFKYISVTLLLLAPAGMFAQFGLPPGFDTKAFSKDEETIFWLLKYDSVMQQTPTPAMELNQPEDDAAFAWTDKKNNWHVVHGTLDTANRFHAASHHTVNSKNKVASSKDKIDSEFADGAARALRNGLLQLKKDMPNDWNKMQRFVRRNIDNGYTVWFLPENKSGNTAYYGMDCTYYFDAKGNHITASKKNTKTAIRSVEKNREQDITLEYPAEKMPTFGVMYFAYQQEANFKSIAVKYKKGTSTLTYNPADKTHAWEHAVN